MDDIDVRWLVLTACVLFLIGIGARAATWIALTRKRDGEDPK